MNDSSEHITEVPYPQPKPSGNGEPAKELPLRVEYALKLEDYAALLHYVTKLSPHAWRQRRLVYALVPVGCFLIVLVGWGGQLAGDEEARWKAFVDLAVIFVIFLIFFPIGLLVKKYDTYRALQRMRHDPRLFGPTVMALAPEGVITSDSTGSGTRYWHAILEIVEHGEYLFFFAVEAETFILPLRAFAEEQSARAFIETARRYHAEARRFVKPEGPA
jgi:hypothetical protein